MAQRNTPPPPHSSWRPSTVAAASRREGGGRGAPCGGARGGADSGAFGEACSSRSPLWGLRRGRQSRTRGRFAASSPRQAATNSAHARAGRHRYGEAIVAGGAARQGHGEGDWGAGPPASATASAMGGGAGPAATATSTATGATRVGRRRATTATSIGDGRRRGGGRARRGGQPGRAGAAAFPQSLHRDAAAVHLRGPHCSCRDGRTAVWHRSWALPVARLRRPVAVATVARDGRSPSGGGRRRRRGGLGAHQGRHGDGPTKADGPKHRTVTGSPTRGEGSPREDHVPARDACCWRHTGCGRSSRSPHVSYCQLLAVGHRECIGKVT